MSGTTYKYGLFAAILVVGVALDQATKWYAAERLATQHPGQVSHEIRLTVPSSADGEQLVDYLVDEFSANTETEVSRIASRAVRTPGGDYLDHDTILGEGQQLVVERRKVNVVEGYVEFEYTENPGAAFGLLSGVDRMYRMPFFVVVSLLAFGTILFILRGLRPRETLLIWALSFIATGAVGNFIDRLRFGRVVDFILLKYTDAYRWPTFNFADAFITAGVAIMFVQLLRGHPPPPSEHEEATDG